METVRRQSGRWHLVRALKDACKEMVALDELNLEMDPQKVIRNQAVYRRSGSAEASALLTVFQIYASATDEEKELFGSNYQENSKMQEILRIRKTSCVDCICCDACHPVI